MKRIAATIFIACVMLKTTIEQKHPFLLQWIRIFSTKKAANREERASSTAANKKEKKGKENEQYLHYTNKRFNTLN